MKELTIKYNILVMFILFWTSASAQVDPCATNLKDAAQKSEQGWYDEAIALIQTTLRDCNLSKNDKITANKLLIVNYLAIDKLEEAEAIAAAIMKIEPNYEADKLRDQTEVILLFQKYKPTVILKGVVSGGVNFSSAHASKTYTVVGNNDAEGLSNYQSITGFQLGIAAESKIYQSFWVQAGVQFRKTSYSIQIPNVQGRTVTNNEDLNYFDIPLSVKYYFIKNRIQPYAQAGVNFSLLSSAFGELSRDDVSDIINRKSQRNEFYIGYFAGAGVGYAFKNVSVQAGLNYLMVPKNLNKEGTRYENLDAVFNYYYIDNDFTMDCMQLSVSISYALGYKNILTDKTKK